MSGRLSDPLQRSWRGNSTSLTALPELGSAELRGQSLAMRARRLIRIAHPAFRDALTSGAADLLRG